MKLRLTAALLLTISLAIAGCAGMRTFEPGTTREVVRSTLGAPSLETKTTSGEVWAYSTAPEGKEVWIFAFDSAGRLVSRVQGLTRARVSQVRDGQTQSDVEALLGPSYWSLRYPFRQDERVHVYRYEDAGTPMCFFVGYNAANTVTSTGSQEELRSAPKVMRPC